MANVPKDDADRVRRNAPKFEDTVITPDDELRGFELPPYPDPAIKWCARTKEWWDMWRRSPQAKIMTESDWWSLLTAAICHNEIWRTRYAPFTGANKPLSSNSYGVLMAELRRREDAVGATWEARQRMRLKVKTDLSEEEAESRIEAAAKGAIDYAEKLAAAAAEAKAKMEADLKAAENAKPSG